MSFRVGSYGDEDEGPTDAIPAFKPASVPGIQLHQVKTRESTQQFMQPIDFFKLFFTQELITMLCSYTNKYASAHIADKPTLSKGWVDINPEEMYRFFGLLYYMAIVNLPRIDLYWSTKTLFHGNWARAFIISRNRYKQICGFLKASNFETENKADKLAKVRFLHDYIRRKCMKLYQPDQNVSIDERMVANKGRYTFR